MLRRKLLLLNWLTDLMMMGMNGAGGGEICHGGSYRGTATVGELGGGGAVGWGNHRARAA